MNVLMTPTMDNNLLLKTAIFEFIKLLYFVSFESLAADESIVRKAGMTENSSSVFS